MTREAWALSLFAGVVLIVGVGLYVASENYSPRAKTLQACESVIKARLKAPSTYERVDYTILSPEMVSLTYDAQNSFGVPLRSRGTCTLNADMTSVDWFEYPS